MAYDQGSLGALTVWWEENLVYWTDLREGTIKRAKMPGKMRSGNTPTFFSRTSLVFACSYPGERGGGGYLGQFLLVICRWAVLTPLLSILWPIIDPILVTDGQIFDFRDPNLVTFYLCILYVGHPKMN